MQPLTRPSAARPPLRHMIDRASGILMIDLLDIMNPAAVMAAVRDIRADPAFSEVRGVCIECGYLSRIPSSEDVRALACACLAEDRTGLCGRWAVVAGWSCFYEAARLFAVLASTPKERVRVFRSAAEALRWVAPEHSAGEPASWAGEAQALHEIIRRAGVGPK